jgi:hypothetical protein
MRLFSLLFCLCIVNATQAQIVAQINFLQPVTSENSDTIYFNPAKNLVWDNFKGTPLQKGMAIAETSSGLGFTAGLKTKNGRGTLTVNIFCYFDKTKSWVKPGKESNYALQHEQNHFNISYIATNNFVRRLKAAKFTTQNYNQLLTEIYTQSLNDLQKMQNDYDGQTQNGIIKAQQLIWNKKIEDEVKVLAKR